jgi:hypothetical protein
MGLRERAAGPSLSKVKFADFELITRSRTFFSSVEGSSDLEMATVDLLRMVFPPKGRRAARSVAFRHFSRSNRRQRTDCHASLILEVIVCRHLCFL